MYKTYTYIYILTLNELAEMILISAGTRSPHLTSIKSPTTKASAGASIFTPPRITKAVYRIKNHTNGSDYSFYHYL